MACFHVLSGAAPGGERLELPRAGLAVVELAAGGAGANLRSLGASASCRSLALRSPAALALCHRSPRLGRPIATVLLPLPGVRLRLGATAPTTLHVLRDGERVTLSRGGQTARLAYHDLEAPSAEPFTGEPCDCARCLVILGTETLHVACPGCGLLFHEGCWHAAPACPACALPTAVGARGTADLARGADWRRAHG